MPLMDLHQNRVSNISSGLICRFMLISDQNYIIASHSVVVSCKMALFLALMTINLK